MLPVGRTRLACRLSRSPAGRLVSKGDFAMKESAYLAVVLALAAAPVPALAAKPASDGITTAIASPDRSPDTVKLDESRKPAELLKFLGLRPGMRVADPFGGNFYWAEITGRAVGPTGHVTVWEPQQFYSQKIHDAYQAVQAKEPNVWMRVSPM